MELHSQFSEMKTKAVLPWNLDVLTHGVSNPHPKVREVLVPLGSHSVTSPPSLQDTAFWTDDNWSLLKCHHLWLFSSREAVWPWPGGTHCHHVVTLHIRLVIIFTFVIELAEEVESHHSIEVNNHSQEANSQNQLGRRKRRCRGVEFQPWKAHGTPSSEG